MLPGLSDSIRHALPHVGASDDQLAKEGKILKTWTLVLFALPLASTALAAPTIDSGGVVNASGYQTTLAPDTVFLVYGHGLGPSSIDIGSGPDYTMNLAGTSIAFTPVSGGDATNVKIVFTLDTQVAGLLPSAIAPGDYQVTVSYKGETSPPEPVTIVARNFGIATANSAGTGPAQVTIGNVNNGISLVRLTSGTLSGTYNWVLTPAHPSDYLVIWGTGGGADPANDTGGTSGDQTVAGNFKVLVGGHEVTPFYAAASSGSPGLWQINFQLPADTAPNCFTELQVSAGGVLSNTATIAVAAAGQDACTSPVLDKASLVKIDTGGTLTGGGFSVIKSTATNSFVLSDGTRTPTVTATSEIFSGDIGTFSAAAVAELYSGIQIDKCTVYQKTAFQPRISIGIPDGALDAGNSVPVSGPNLSANTALQSYGYGLYDLALSAGTLTGGTYTFTGSGGKDVAAFSGSTTFPNDFTATNFDSIQSIDRAKPLTLTWTGGGAGLVQIDGNFQSTISGSGDDPSTWKLQATTFTCNVPASLGTYTVPAAVFGLLPPSSFDLTSGNQAYLSVFAVPTRDQAAFQFPLTAGGHTDWGSIGYSVGVTKNLPVLP